MKILPIEAHGRDLYAKLECVCPSDLFKDSPISHLMKTKITLIGYDDANFFENVNKIPRDYQCQCGRKFSYQWKNDGVHIQDMEAS